MNLVQKRIDKCISSNNCRLPESFSNWLVRNQIAFCVVLEDIQRLFFDFSTHFFSFLKFNYFAFLKSTFTRLSVLEIEMFWLQLKTTLARRSWAPTKGETRGAKEARSASRQDDHGRVLGENQNGFWSDQRAERSGGDEETARCGFGRYGQQFSI